MKENETMRLQAVFGSLVDLWKIILTSAKNIILIQQVIPQLWNWNEHEKQLLVDGKEQVQ